MEIDATLEQVQTLYTEGKYEEARALVDTLLKENPEASASPRPWRALGVVTVRLGRPKEALRAFHRALEIDPKNADAHFSLALFHLSHGNFEQGFIEYEWRFSQERCVIPAFMEAPVWDGRPLEKEAMLLHCEQGLGDAMQFIRFLPQVCERVKTVYLACHPELARLFSGLKGLAGILRQEEAFPSYQVQCPLLSLPRIFHTTTETLPATVPYLPMPTRSTPSKKREGRLRVGFVWRARFDTIGGRYRSMLLKELRPLADLPIDWVSLQKDPRPEERTLLKEVFHAEDLGSDAADFQETAERVLDLDLVIAVDTSILHLVGGLGRPVWVVVPKWADWRWGLTGTTSRWYPTATLWRQEIERDWSGPVQAMRSALANFPTKS